MNLLEKTQDQKIILTLSAEDSLLYKERYFEEVSSRFESMVIRKEGFSEESFKILKSNFDLKDNKYNLKYRHEKIFNVSIFMAYLYLNFKLPIERLAEKNPKISRIEIDQNISTDIIKMVYSRGSPDSIGARYPIIKKYYNFALNISDEYFLNRIEEFSELIYRKIKDTVKDL